MALEVLLKPIFTSYSMVIHSTKSALKFREFCQESVVFFINSLFKRISLLLCEYFEPNFKVVLIGDINFLTEVLKVLYLDLLVLFNSSIILDIFFYIFI